MQLDILCEYARLYTISFSSRLRHFAGVWGGWFCLAGTPIWFLRFVGLVSCQLAGFFLGAQGIKVGRLKPKTQIYDDKQTKTVRFTLYTITGTLNHVTRNG